jgi:hypothetical protein
MKGLYRGAMFEEGPDVVGTQREEVWNETF